MTKPFFHINNKKIIKGFLSDIVETPEQIQQITNLIDKFDKIGAEKFLQSLETDLNITGTKKEKILTLLDFSTDQIEHIDQLSSLSDNTDFQQGIFELKTVLSHLEQIKTALKLSFSRVVDMKIVRGLDYYTGTIREAVFAQNPIGSICGGGRYANLTGYIDPKRQDYCGVWGSIGISRILSRIFDEQQMQKATIADYLIVHFEKSLEIWLQIAFNLQKQGKNFEIYPAPEKFGKQLAYADKKGIPAVIICGESEIQEGIYKIKDMKTWEETSFPL